MEKSPEAIPFNHSPATQSVQQVFAGQILQAYVNQVQLPNGLVVDRELIHHGPAVCVLALTNEDQVVLVNQYRPAAGKNLYEIPAGLIDRLQGQLEEPLSAAQRELEEETHYQAGCWKKGPTFFVSPGYLDEEITLFLAQDLSVVEDPKDQDDDEAVEWEVYNRQEISEMLKKGKIVDLKTLYALQIWLGGMERDVFI